MLKKIVFLLLFSSMSCLSQDTIPKEPFISIDTIQVTYQKIPTNIKYNFQCTVDLYEHVNDYLDFLSKYDIDPKPLSTYDGIYTVNQIRLFAVDTNTIGLTFRAVPEANVKSMSIIDGKAGLDSLSLKTLVYHEMTHMMTNNELPHCKDWVNCSAIFYEYLATLQGRIEKYWDMEEEQLANMIKIYQKYDK